MLVALDSSAEWLKTTFPTIFMLAEPWWCTIAGWRPGGPGPLSPPISVFHITIMV